MTNHDIERLMNDRIREMLPDVALEMCGICEHPMARHVDTGVSQCAACNSTIVCAECGCDGHD